MIALAIVGYLILGFISAVIYQKIDGGYSEPWELAMTLFFWPLVGVCFGAVYGFCAIGMAIDWVAEGGFVDLWRKYKEMRDD